MPASSDTSWTATRRGGHAVLVRTTLTASQAMIEGNYRTGPVPRAFNPAGST
jgi:hypothetical protein